MPAYAIAHLESVTIGPHIVEYLQGIDATLAPYGGRSMACQPTTARQTSSTGAA